MLHGYQYFKGMFITAYVITTRKTTIHYIENLRPHIQIPHLTSTVIEGHTLRCEVFTAAVVPIVEGRFWLYLQEVTRSFKVLVTTDKTTWLHNPQRLIYVTYIVYLIHFHEL
jgi:hypothetical protein